MQVLLDRPPNGIGPSDGVHPRPAYSFNRRYLVCSRLRERLCKIVTVFCVEVTTRLASSVARGSPASRVPRAVRGSRGDVPPWLGTECAAAGWGLRWARRMSARVPDGAIPMTNDVYTSFLMGWRQPPPRCAASSPAASFWSEPKRSVSGPQKRVQLTFRSCVFVKAEWAE